MKIVFLCAALEMGKDGVGDYTFKLAMACHTKGESVAIISINDGFVQSVKNDNYPFLTVRLPKNMGWDEKAIIITNLLGDIKPDWMSLQFVTYSFHPKGFVLSNLGFFKAITTGFKVQLMLHELWIGEELSRDFKRTIIGKIQKWNILKFIKNIAPAVVNTSIPLYKKILLYYGVKSKLLPLFGNISISAEINGNWVTQEILQRTGEEIGDNNRDQYVIAGFFGKLYPNWGVDRILSGLHKFQKEGKKIILTSVGQIGSGVSLWNEYEKMYPLYKFVLMGPQSELKISGWMQYIDFGIAATPYILLGKSGSFLAMTEHGLPVICQDPMIKFRFEYEEKTAYTNLTVVKAQLDWNEIPKKTVPKSQLEEITDNFLLTLRDIKT